MAFVETVPEDQAAGATAEMYATDEAAFGYLPNFTRAFSLRPAVYAAWRRLNGAIKSGMDLRRYELATVAAARRLHSSYCTLAHGSVLMDKFLDADSVAAVRVSQRIDHLVLGRGHVPLVDERVLRSHQCLSYAIRTVADHEPARDPLRSRASLR